MEGHLDEVADGLFSVLLTMVRSESSSSAVCPSPHPSLGLAPPPVGWEWCPQEVIPYICSMRGEASEMVAKRLDKRLREYLYNLAQSGGGLEGDHDWRSMTKERPGLWATVADCEAHPL